MFVKQTLSLIALLAGGPLLLTSCGFGGEPWQEYIGTETEGQGVNSFYHRTSDQKICFVGREKQDTMNGTYAGHYNRETAEVNMYVHVPQLKMLTGSAEYKAIDVTVDSENQPQNPGELATLLLTDSPVDKKVQEEMDPTSISNTFTTNECWSEDEGLPKSLAGTLKERF